jgi:16S rRNA (uracil1498-N3)-methyltransferase
LPDAQWLPGGQPVGLAFGEQFAVANRRAHEQFAVANRRLDERLAVANRRLDEQFAVANRRLDERLAQPERRPVRLAVRWLDPRRPQHGGEHDESGDVEPDVGQLQLATGRRLSRPGINLASMDSLVPVAGPPVFLVPPEDLAAGTVTLTGPEGHHAAAVRRLRPGERADVSDGAGTLAEGVVTAVARDSVTLAVHAVHAVPAPDPRITVVQALPKGDRGELAVELMTEIGVDSVIAWSAERCVTRWHGDRGTRSLGKWQSTAREATKQSRRPWLPEITGPATLADITKRASAATQAIVLEADAPAKLSTLALPDSGEIILIVGPEGGISPTERTTLSAAGAVEARLGPTVLRTSTAGAAAAAILMTRTARW